MPGILERGYEAMSMTRKEAADIIENKIQIDVRLCTDKEVDRYQEALYMALSAIRTPTREMVERMRREWTHTHSTDNFWTEVWKCSYCGFEDDHGCCFDFCPDCGTPMTDEAVDILWQRWKEAVDGEND